MTVLSLSSRTYVRDLEILRFVSLSQDDIEVLSQDDIGVLCRGDKSIAIKTGYFSRTVRAKIPSDLPVFAGY
jgi:hypothetical protein